MHHKNHKNSTANHNNPAHHKPEHMHYQYGRNDLPNPQRPAKRSVLSRITERFKEKEVTPDELRSLKMKAQKETYKTQIQKAKSARPSRFGGFGGEPRQASYRRGSSRAPPQTGSWLMGDSGRMGDSFFSGGGSGPSLDFITGASQKPSRRKQDSGFGQGLTDLF